MQLNSIPPVLFLNEVAHVPVYLQNVGGTAPVTGIAYSILDVKYSRASDSTLNTFAPAVDQWSERGRGFYALTLPSSVLNEAGMFELLITPVSGADLFVAAGAIQRRAVDEILEHTASGYDENTVGDLIFEAGTKYEVFSSAQYDAATDTFSVSTWIHLNGERLIAPTSCRVIIKNMESGATVFDQVSTSPDGNGIFYIEQTGIVLADKLNMAAIARITVDGEDHNSHDGVISFN